MSRVEELDLSFRARFTLVVIWKDPRLEYENLKKDILGNIVDEDTARRIWIPPLFIETSIGESSGILVFDEASMISVLMEEENPKISDFSSLHESILYQGDKNSLMFTRTYDLEQTCIFDLTLYPFDTQECAINVSSKNCHLV